MATHVSFRQFNTLHRHQAASSEQKLVRHRLSTAFIILFIIKGISIHKYIWNQRIVLFCVSFLTTNKNKRKYIATVANDHFDTAARLEARLLWERVTLDGEWGRKGGGEGGESAGRERGRKAGCSVAPRPSARELAVQSVVQVVARETTILRILLLVTSKCGQLFQLTRSVGHWRLLQNNIELKYVCKTHGIKQFTIFVTYMILWVPVYLCPLCDAINQ